MTNPDIVIIGSGIGGATIASGLAGSGASILMLERGEPLPATVHARDTRSIFVDGYYRPKEMWREAGGAAADNDDVFDHMFIHRANCLEK